MADDKAKQLKIENIIKRLQYYKNPLDQMELHADATPEDIQKKYKKIALFVHPDKCKHEKAVDAFASLNKALKLLENEDQRNQYSEISKQGEIQVSEEWLKMGRKRKSGDERDYKYDCQKMSQKLILDIEFRMKRADEMKMANERREKEDKMKAHDEAIKEAEAEKTWEEGRSKRVNEWRKFVKGKKQKQATKTAKKGPGPLKPPKVKLETK